MKKNGYFLFLALLISACQKQADLVILETANVKIKFQGDIENGEIIKFDDLEFAFLRNDTNKIENAGLGENLEPFFINGNSKRIRVPASDNFLYSKDGWLRDHVDSGLMVYHFSLAFNKMLNRSEGLDEVYQLVGNSAMAVMEKSITIKRLDGKKMNIAYTKGMNIEVISIE